MATTGSYETLGTNTPGSLHNTNCFSAIILFNPSFIKFLVVLSNYYLTVV